MGRRERKGVRRVSQVRHMFDFNPDRMVSAKRRVSVFATPKEKFFQKRKIA